MTTRADFTEEEWTVLQKTLQEPATAVMAASRGGLFRESFAFGQAIYDAASEYSANELIQDLIRDAQSNKDQGGGSPASKAEELYAGMALNLCRGVTIVRARGSEAELADYKKLLYAIADRVANAAKEGAFLGIFGGVRVSPEEQHVLDIISSALECRTIAGDAIDAGTTAETLVAAVAVTGSAASTLATGAEQASESAPGAGEPPPLEQLGGAPGEQGEVY